MRNPALSLALGCCLLTACLQTSEQVTPNNRISLAECVQRATAAGTTELACDCGPCATGDVCTKVGRCGKVVDGNAQPAKVMLALDRSGSMKTLPESDTDWGCAQDSSGSGYDPSGSCKWNQLKELVAGPGGMLDQGAVQARFGLALFPDTTYGEACSSGRIEVPVLAQPGQGNASISRLLASATPGGGTPSAETLRNVASDPDFTYPDASRYVVLVTDGMPNCNASIATCTACTNTAYPEKLCSDPRNCLDDVSLVHSVATLKAKGIDTFIVGFGASLASPVTAAVLDAAAEEGGRALAGDRKYYQAGSAAELPGHHRGHRQAPAALPLRALAPAARSGSTSGPDDQPRSGQLAAAHARHRLGAGRRRLRGDQGRALRADPDLGELQLLAGVPGAGRTVI
ncbi:MAG: hypothetical protein QM765_23790 [Myxococcales bacterium]